MVGQTFRAGIWAALGLVASTGVTWGAWKSGYEIEPGPRQITAEERAIGADPQRGIEHAVILVLETERNEDLGPEMQTRHHLRAKVLSNEGRDLADIEIPVGRHGKLKDWWGRTLLPDGRVLELDFDDLERQALAVRGSAEVAVWKAALPGVVPGAVIDYGYTLREPGYVPYERVRLQRRWPIRSLQFNWKPTTYFQGAFRLVHTERLDVRARVEKQAILVHGNDLPPVIEEPLMPPDHEVRGALVLYYIPIGTVYDRFWDDVASTIEQIIDALVGKKRQVRRALEQMQIPESGPLEDRLRAVYDWINERITVSELRAFEEVQRASEDVKRKRDLIANLLETREGSGFEVQLLFIGVARALGADARFVLAADRTENFWDPHLKSLNQFGATLVAVRRRGAPREQSVLLDPGSGLPYGEIPWWLGGGNALLLEEKQGFEIGLPVSGATSNVRETEVTLRFAEDNELLVGSWSRSGSGQVDLSEQRYLRRLSPDERMDRVERLCGAGSDGEVVEADVSGLDRLGETVTLRCRFESYRTNPDEEVDDYRLGWNGPWMEPLPALDPGERRHPVVFDFPSLDLTRIDIEPPQGFVAGDLPEPAEVNSPFGRYKLVVSRRGDGFHLERGLALVQLAVPAADYDELRAFFEEVARLDRSPLAFRRQP